ncbi:MAG: DUF3857 domain-containing protein [Bacteroidota bacterium]|nr:DUF3857 domain-containing protein [Bacteroidota bacterium]
MKFKRYFFLLLILPASVFAADFVPYEWEANRSRTDLTAEEASLTELMIKNHIQYDYVLENNDFLMYSTIHRIIFVNNNEAIQKHNRIVISMNSTIDLVEIKARSINKDGKVVRFDKSNIKELKNEESGNAYRIFAIEGIELGSEVEYYFIRKMRSNLFQRAVMQMDVPVKSASFTLSCPRHLKFDFKSYFGFPDVKEKAGEEVNTYTASMKDVPAMKKEDFSYYDANLKRIEFKLAYNTARSQARLYTWDEAAKTFYGILSHTEKDDVKALDRFVKTLDDKPSLSMDARIRNVERKIKTTVQVNRESADPAIDEIASIIKLKVASRQGITKLFVAVYDRLGIECHPVVTCSRKDSRFDGEFDSWSYLDEYLLYFPQTKGYVAPYVLETRYPLVPAEFTGQDGLFIEPFTVGELKSGLGSVKHIPAVEYVHNIDNLDIDVAFDDDLSVNRVRIKRIFGGYNATFFSPYYHLMTDEQRHSMVEELTKQTAPDPRIKDWTARPLEDGPVDRFLIDVDFESTHFIEKAGPRVLFKIGELIGPQVEMYREDARVTDVENEYNRGYDRVIKIKLPDGYTVRNPQELKFDVTYKDKDATPFLFQSDYTLKDQLLTVTIYEYYKELYAPVERYEDYRKVVNAAADFNKVTLVLEKVK